MEPNMTSTQLNAEVLRNMSIIAEDEALLKRVAKYLRKVVTEKQAKTTLMTEEELRTKIEQAERDYQQGKTYAMLPGESFKDFRDRIGR